MTSHDMTAANLQPTAVHSHTPWPFRRSVAMRYGVALLAVLVAFSIRYMIYGNLQNRLVFTFFVPAAMIAVWYGGLGPGMLAIVLGLLLGDYFFMMSRKALWPLGNRESLAVGAFVVTTLLCVLLCEKLHRRIRQFERALEQERHHKNVTLCPEAQEFAEYLTRYYALPNHHLYAYPSWPYRRSIARRFGVAIGVVTTAFLLRYYLFGTQDTRLAFIFFVPGALIAVWYGGILPGLLATAGGLMLGDFFFLTNHEALGAVLEFERMQIGLYAVMTTLCVILFENLHERTRRLEHAFDRARHHHVAHADPIVHGETPGASAAR